MKADLNKWEKHEEKWASKKKWKKTLLEQTVGTDKNTAERLNSWSIWRMKDYLLNLETYRRTQKGNCKLDGIWPQWENTSVSSSSCQFTSCLVSWGCWIHRLHLWWGVSPPHECPGYDTWQFDGAVPVMLELWEMWSTS